jgi:energy-coupling factor transporter ATP-binding protein EcfA2
VNKRIQSARVQRFKGISDAPFDAAAMNVFIGANNSGKSTLAQMLHFGIGILQSIELARKWGGQSNLSVSLSPDQLLYSPCADLYSLGHNGQLIEQRSSAISLSLVLSDGERIGIEIRRGRNGNILVHVSNVSAARTLSSLEEPFTIYSPGLAGIARSEVFISNGVLRRTIARGDANLVLRNMLLRLSSQGHEAALREFLDDLRMLFPEIRIDVKYSEETDEHIMVYADTGAGWVPIELAGTGVLQAVQILGYVHYFHPSVIILDEPDSHLHPNNQRLLCKLLQGVAEDRDTQVFLTTHSRHVVDALSGQAAFFWVHNGTVEKMDQDQDLAVLLEIGALDVKEMLSQSQAKCIVLTEDALKRGLEVLLESSGVKRDEALVLAYYGCTNPHNLRPLLELIRVSNPNAKIVVHRDRDYLDPTEAAAWEVQIRNMDAEPFLTDGVDVESHFLNAKHLAALNGRTEAEIDAILEEATEATLKTSIEKYINGRTDIEKKAGTFAQLNLGQLGAKAPDVVRGDLTRYRYAKTVLKAARAEYQRQYGMNMRAIETSNEVLVDQLAALAKKL